jgi:hypothetical protein
MPNPQMNRPAIQGGHMLKPDALARVSPTRRVGVQQMKDSSPPLEVNAEDIVAAGENVVAG